MTVVGHLEVVTVSKSAEFRPFLLIMCIDAPESTTNSLPSGLIFDGEGRHHFTVGEKNVVLCFSLTSGFSLPASTLLCEPSALATLSLPETDPQCRSIGTTLMRILTTNFIERRILVSKFGIAQDCSGESDTSDWSRRG